MMGKQITVITDKILSLLSTTSHS